MAQGFNNVAMGQNFQTTTPKVEVHYPAHNWPASDSYFVMFPTVQVETSRLATTAEAQEIAKLTNATRCYVDMSNPSTMGASGRQQWVVDAQGRVAVNVGGLIASMSRDGDGKPGHFDLGPNAAGQFFIFA